MQYNKEVEMSIVDSAENGGGVYNICPMCGTYHMDACTVCNKCLDSLQSEQDRHDQDNDSGE